MLNFYFFNFFGIFALKKKKENMSPKQLLLRFLKEHKAYEKYRVESRNFQRKSKGRMQLFSILYDFQWKTTYDGFDFWEALWADYSKLFIKQLPF